MASCQASLAVSSSVFAAQCRHKAHARLQVCLLLARLREQARGSAKQAGHTCVAEGRGGHGRPSSACWGRHDRY